MAKRIFLLGKPGPDTFALQREVDAALEAEGIKRCTVRIIDDEIVAMEFGVSLFPTLVVDEIVRAIGRVPPKAEIVNLLHMLQEYLDAQKSAKAAKTDSAINEDVKNGDAAASGDSPVTEPMEAASGSNGDADAPVS